MLHHLGPKVRRIGIIGNAEKDSRKINKYSDNHNFLSFLG